MFNPFKIFKRQSKQTVQIDPIEMLINQKSVLDSKAKRVNFWFNQHQATFLKLLHTARGGGSLDQLNELKRQLEFSRFRCRAEIDDKFTVKKV